MYSMAYLDGNAGERRPLTFICTYCIFCIGYMQSVKTNVTHAGVTPLSPDVPR